MSDNPFKTTKENIEKFLTRPYADLKELLDAIHAAAKTRPDGTFMSDKVSTVAMGIAAHNVLRAFSKAYKPGEEINLIADECSKPYEHTDEITRTTIVNAFVPLLSAAVKAFNDVDLLAGVVDGIAKVLCDVREKHENDSEPYSQDFLESAKRITKLMKPLVGNVSHGQLVGDDEENNCGCPACTLRRAVKAKHGVLDPKAKDKAKGKANDIPVEVHHMQLNLNPEKPETWEQEIAKLGVPEEVQKMILAKMQEEHGVESKPSPKMQPPTGFNVDFRRN